MIKYYNGEITPMQQYLVSVDNLPLDPRYDLFCHADRFCWGTLGSGTYQLATALLASFSTDEDALKYTTLFARLVLAKFAPHRPWRYTNELFQHMLNNLKVSPTWVTDYGRFSRSIPKTF